MAGGTVLVIKSSKLLIPNKSSIFAISAWFGPIWRLIKVSLGASFVSKAVKLADVTVFELVAISKFGMVRVKAYR